MAAAGGLGDSAAFSTVDAPSVKDELLRLDERLKLLMSQFEETPSAIDNGLLTPSRSAPGIETVITQVYRTMNDRVYSEQSPVRVDDDLWEAFHQQRDEFIGFYKSALNAVEMHKEVLRVLHDREEPS